MTKYCLILAFLLMWSYPANTQLLGYDLATIAFRFQRYWRDFTSRYRFRHFYVGWATDGLTSGHIFGPISAMFEVLPAKYRADCSLTLVHINSENGPISAIAKRSKKSLPLHKNFPEHFFLHSLNCWMMFL